jgi:thioredoxin reductase
MLDYTSWFQNRAVPDIEDETVVALDRQGGGFTARLASGRIITAKDVVVATGQHRFRFIPPVLETLPKNLFSHTTDHRDFSRFRNCRVAVVGIGQSALETAALLSEHGAHARVFGRRTNVIWNPKPPETRTLARKVKMPESGLAEGWVSLAYSELPQAFRMLTLERRRRILGGTYGPSGAWWLKDRVDGKVPVHTGHEIAEAKPYAEAVALTVSSGDHSDRIIVDHVIAGTGFKVDIARLPFLAPSLRSSITTFSGYPKLTPQFESTVPGLFFVGAPSALAFGPVMRFMFGAKHAAHIVARALKRRAHLPR